MLKKIWRKITATKAQVNTSERGSSDPVLIPRSGHNVSRKNISRSATKILYRLNEAGYQAYLVGGGVRDILLGLNPKDFDIATDATPEEIHKLFRNSRIIGRRFRLVHIMFGREVIEVATFRAGHDDSCQTQAKTSTHGMLVRDNVFGNLEEDAFRRDFTVNALYYTVEDFSVLDYVGGLEDLEKKQLRLIGDPVTRYREDPVRILRAIRLSCKLGLSIEKETAAPISELSEMLEHISPARLWEESNKIFLAGHAFKTWHDLIDRGVAQHLFSATITALNNDSSGNFSQFIDNALNSTDKRISQSQPVTPAFLFAVFLWQPVQNETERLRNKGMVPYEASQKAASKIFEKQRETIAVPKRFSITAREIWSLQFRLFNRRKKNVDSLIAHPKFRAAYDFLVLRAGTDQQLQELAEWWTEFQNTTAEKQFEMIKIAAKSTPSKNKKRRKPSAAKNKKR
jgi:poly(A) polymerase